MKRKFRATEFWTDRITRCLSLGNMILSGHDSVHLPISVIREIRGSFLLVPALPAWPAIHGVREGGCPTQIFLNRALASPPKPIGMGFEWNLTLPRLKKNTKTQQ